ncbi:MAG: anthranilate synthase component I family protein [Microbacterium sp.]
MIPLEAEPDAIFAHLFGDAPSAIWLDSAREAYGSGRWSIMGAPDEVLTGIGWSDLAERMARQDVETELPFAGGWVCTISDEGEITAARLSSFLLLDHEHGLIHERGCATAAALAAVPPLPEAAPPIETGRAEASVTRERYLDDLTTIRRWLLDGDSYEACYTYQLRFDMAEPGFEAYRRLRRSNPAPFGAYLRLDGREVLSCSPERFLRVEKDGWAEAKPIKGTAPSSSDPALLAADPKARAENLMIADLLRNDLGRICRPGTVEVPVFCGVETYATVHQLVTTVRGRLCDGVDAVGAAEALFPPGSMTGAPKIRTVRLLADLEGAPRGLYSGAIGYFSDDGTADLSVVIRTAIIEDGRVSIGTGGAITIDSDPESELAETITKSAAMLAAFGRTHPLATAE